ncbi:MAG: hypothetical protein JXQ73_12880 [Phycisphaerae bacterium]|nr:hypothetical protein [Phycisphaerae bacterium]
MSYIRTITGALVASASMGQIALAQPVSFERLRALGDSLTIGTQGGMISDERNQPRSWPAILARQMGTTLYLPLLEEMTLIGNQRRVDYPDYQYAHVMAFNGVSVDDTYMKTCEELPWYVFGWDWNHINLVLAPRWGESLLSAVVSDNPTFVVGYLGANDYMNKVMAKGTVMENIPFVEEVEPLDGSGMRPQDLFLRDYEVVIHALYQPGRGICFGTMPVLPDVPGLLSKQQLTDFIGPNPMPDGCYTDYIIAAAIYTGLLPEWTPEMLTDDRNYYTPAEIQYINDQIAGYNNTIRSLAADPNHPFAVAESPIQMPEITSGAFRVNGWRINAEVFVNNLGKPRASIMSTDTVHMSDIGHALTAMAFIRAINAFYGTSIPEPTESELTAILNNDRFVDNDGDGRIEGLSCNAFYLSMNLVYGDALTGDSGEVPRNAKVLTIGYVNGLWGSVTTDVEGPEYFEGRTVQLTATPVDGRTFDHWEGDVPGGVSTDNPLTITMDADKSVVAVFKCGGAGAALPLATVLMLLTFARLAGRFVKTKTRPARRPG